MMFSNHLENFAKQSEGWYDVFVKLICAMFICNPQTLLHQIQRT